MTMAKSMDELILVFDAGTQSIRAALIDLEGHVAQIVKTPITPYFSHQPGWAVVGQPFDKEGCHSGCILQ